MTINIPIIPVIIAIVAIIVLGIFVLKQRKDILEKDITIKLQRTVIETQKMALKADDDTIQTLTKYVQESIKEGYEKQDKLKEKDINEYGIPTETREKGTDD